MNELERWSEPAMGARDRLRACFCLELPVNDGAPFVLRFLLQSPDDPSLLVPASDAWQTKGRSLEKLGRAFRDPQESLLEALGRASRLFPPLAGSLEEARPESVDLDPATAWTFVGDGAALLAEAGFGVIVPGELTAAGQRRLRLRMRVGGSSKKVAGVVAGTAGLALDELLQVDWEAIINFSEKLGCEVVFLHGGTPKKARDEMVRRFQEEPHDPRIFVLSVKAGGTGLNLTAASHVFHYDRWWNSPSSTAGSFAISSRSRRELWWTVMTRMLARQHYRNPDRRHAQHASAARCAHESRQPLSQRVGEVLAHPVTWYKLIRERGWAQPRSREYPQSPTVGIRATMPNEAWHVDTTIIKLLDGTKAYLHAVIDNYSRKILSWTVAETMTPSSTYTVLVEAMKHLPTTATNVIMDSGIENVNAPREPRGFTCKRKKRPAGLAPSGLIYGSISRWNHAAPRVALSADCS